MIKKTYYIVKLIYSSSKVYVFSSLAISISLIAEPLINVYALKYIMDQLNDGKSIESIGFSLLVLFATLLFVVLLRTTLKNRFIYTSEEKLTCVLKTNFYNKVSKMPLIELEKSDYYDKYSKSLMVIVNKQKSIFNEVLKFISSFSIIISMLAFILALDYFIIIISIFIMIIILVASNVSGKIEFDYYNSNINHVRFQNYIDEVFYNKRYADEIRIYNSSKLFLEHYKEKSSLKNDNTIAFSLKRSVFAFFKLFSNSSHTLIIIFYLSYKVIYDGMAIGSFAALLVSSQMLIQSMKSILVTFPNLRKELYFFDDYVAFTKYLEYNSKLQMIEFLQVDTIKKIELNSVFFKYPNTKTFVLNNINQTFSRGQKIAFVGLNGSGKTTLSKVISNQFEPSDGVVKYNGIVSAKICSDDIYSNVSIVSQNFNIFNLSILENISMLKERYSITKRVWLCLEKVGLKKKVESLKDGLKTELGKMYVHSGTNFSGGEMQRIAIARALYKDSSVIILDESSSSLDPLMENEINNIVVKHSKDKILIVIAHRLSIMSKMDKILVLDKGTIVEEGTHLNLLDKKKKYFNIYTKNNTNI